MAMRQRFVLVTGATGYVGGRLVPRLVDAGHRVRVLVRDPARLQGRPWVDQVEVAVGDVMRPETLPAALQDVDVAYYLVHSMRSGADFQERDLAAARSFGAAARAVGVQRIVYLGGLGDPATNLSQHLRSRQQTGEVLRQSGVPVTEFRAAIIVGSGSVSFEMIRYIVERQPALICPRWVFTRVQPIAIRNVLSYLIDALEVPESAGQIIEIGGADVLTYAEMMLGYARARGLRRALLPIPVAPMRLSAFPVRASAYWVHLVTPIPTAIAEPLIEGLRNEVIVRDESARRFFPNIHPLDYQTAVHLALTRLEAGQVETIWSDPLISSQRDTPLVKATTQEGMIIEQRQRTVDVPAEAVYRIFAGIGGARGWYYANWTWWWRGVIDRLVGGVGLRRGRRHPDEIRVGDALDFWRVEAVEPGRRLLLRAEMKVPGRAWLQLEAYPRPDGSTFLVVTAFFAPKGLSGLLYWYALHPVHARIFSGMVRAIARRAEAAVERSHVAQLAQAASTDLGFRVSGLETPVGNRKPETRN